MCGGKPSSRKKQSKTNDQRVLEEEEEDKKAHQIASPVPRSLEWYWTHRS